MQNFHVGQHSKTEAQLKSQVGGRNSLIKKRWGLIFVLPFGGEKVVLGSNFDLKLHDVVFGGSCVSFNSLSAIVACLVVLLKAGN